MSSQPPSSEGSSVLFLVFHFLSPRPNPSASLCDQDFAPSLHHPWFLRISTASSQATATPCTVCTASGSVIEEKNLLRLPVQFSPRLVLLLKRKKTVFGGDGRMEEAAVVVLSCKLISPAFFPPFPLPLSSCPSLSPTLSSPVRFKICYVGIVLLQFRSTYLGFLLSLPNIRVYCSRTERKEVVISVV